MAAARHPRCAVDRLCVDSARVIHRHFHIDDVDVDDVDIDDVLVVVLVVPGWDRWDNDDGASPREPHTRRAAR